MKAIDVEAAKEYVLGNYPNDLLLRTMAMTLLDSLPFVEMETESKIEDKTTWISINKREPTHEEWQSAEMHSFICKVFVPAPGGVACEEMRIIEWLPGEGWDCNDVIVHSWTHIPKGGEESA